MICLHLECLLRCLPRLPSFSILQWFYPVYAGQADTPIRSLAYGRRSTRFESGRAFTVDDAEPTLQLKTWTIPYNDYAGKEKDLKEMAAWSDAVIGFLGD